MDLVVNFKDERINANCAIVREKIIAFENYNQDMTKAQVVTICNEIITAMIDILQMTQE